MMMRLSSSNWSWLSLILTGMICLCYYCWRQRILAGTRNKEPSPSAAELCAWGTMRPFPYIGLRCRSPSSPLIGVMWYRPSLLVSPNSHNNNTWESILRHECSYKDRLRRFGWTKHDGRDYGSQQISDSTNQVDLTVQWVQINASRWALRIHGEPIASTPSTVVDHSLLVYLVTSNNLTASVTQKNHIVGHHLDRSGENSLSYRLWLDDVNKSNQHPTYANAGTGEGVTYNASAYFFASHIEADAFNPKPTVISELQDPTSSLPPHLFDPGSLYRAATVRTGNQLILQVFYELPFTVDVHFAYDLDSTAEGENKKEGAESKIKGLTGKRQQDWSMEPILDPVSEALQQASDQWGKRFQATFGTANWTTNQLATAQYAVSNMLGSLTYMYGDQQLLVNNSVITVANTSELLAIVPDRPNHAQGFFWDEGFHQHLVSLWNSSLSFAIVSSWFAQTDQNGWIARQQMLGDEIRWGARPSSWPQVPGTANPPSLHLFLETLLRRHFSATGTICPRADSELHNFLRSIWDPFQRNVRWYLRTQQSPLSNTSATKYLMRWAGRTPRYCLPSGMDDYPRAPVLTTREAHLDLQVWMIVSTRAAENVARCLGDMSAANEFAHFSQTYRRALLEHFWDDERGIFDEFYYVNGSNGTMIKRWNGHFGYLNFFPLFLDVMDTNSSMFSTTVHQLLNRTNGLWSPYGLRSLSAHDPYYQGGDNYWTGPIWVNINTLALSALYRYNREPDRFPMPEMVRDEIHTAYQSLHHSLRSTVVNSFVRTGFVWEVYDGDAEGRGLNNHPFTGWTALIVNIMAEQY